MRQQIIKMLDVPFEQTGSYDRLKRCIESPYPFDEGLDDWFRGVIQSLFYRPNHKMLVLLGEPNIGKTEFFRRLLPQEKWYAEGMSDIYKKLIINLDEDMQKPLLQLVDKQDFQVMNPYSHDIYCEKRLASYCCATHYWRYPPRKSTILIRVEHIDKDAYNAIDKQQLWIEIFNRFSNDNISL